MKRRRLLFLLAPFLPIFFSFPHAAFAALSFDGTTQGGGYVSLATSSLTTSNSNDVIVAYALTIGTSLAISDVAGLTWHSRAATSTTGGGLLEEWYAIAPSPLSNDVITVTTNNNYEEFNAFGVSGANTSSPFDPGGPVTGTSTDTDLISTTNSNTMVIAAFSYGNAPPDASAGFNLIYSQDFLASEYGLFSSPQTDLSITNDQGNTQGSIVDALQAASGGEGSPTGRIIRLFGGLHIFGGVHLEP
jgi:hypothetical protein